MEKIAIIGSGIAGMGCAHFLHKQYEITLFEKNNYVGGHTNTIYIEEENKKLPVDSGFIVFNFENYPNLTRLFQLLKVPYKKTSMSFSAQHLPAKIEYGGNSLDHLFAQRRNLTSVRYFKFLLQVKRFNKECLEVFSNEKLQNLSIEEFVHQKRYGADFLNWFIIPMSSALWSTPPSTTAKFPMLNLVRFFSNHGLLGLNTQFQWYTVDGGSEEYKKLLINSFAHQIQVNRAIVGLELSKQFVKVKTNDGVELQFDKVIFANHADQAMKILGNAFQTQQFELLKHFIYQDNTAILHKDGSLMPQRKKIWSSWNYRVDNHLFASTTYWMNCLQGISNKVDYFLTINDSGIIDPKTILKEIVYEHPIFTVEAMEAQQQLSTLNQNGQLYFCGSYFGNGFHEDALSSAISVCETILQRNVWN